MNRDEAEGTAKEMEGKLTGDQSREWEGRTQDTLGGAKEAADDARDAASGVVKGAGDAMKSDRD
jgi:uncharacterized protein YjbJ (UPF0337 family)